MNPNDLPFEVVERVEVREVCPPHPRVGSPVTGRTDAMSAPKAGRESFLPPVCIGELLAISDDGLCRPLIRYTAPAGEATLAARTTVDLHGRHIGAQVILVFEAGDETRPIVIGVLREQAGWPLQDAPATVEADADGQRLIVSAKEQLVLRCGKASITLTRAGKVLLEGSYVLSRSTGVNRIKGGSVQLN